MSLTLAQETRVVEETNKYIKFASDLFNTNYPEIPIKFNLTGHTMGMYTVMRTERSIRYHSLIFSKYFEENLRDTVPHEVAHYVIDLQYGTKRVRPHGDEWKSIMNKFGADASRTANYDLSDIPKRRYQTVTYRCSCQHHELGVRRHNKVLKGSTRYTCRECGEALIAA